MRIHKVFLVILTLVLVITIGHSLINAQKVSVNDPHPFSVTSNQTASEDEIKDNLGRANYCSQSADCSVKSYGCPFGCYSLVNKTEDLTLIESDIAGYYSTGNQCVYDCDRDPQLGEIGCVNNKCVDLRYIK